MNSFHDRTRLALAILVLAWGSFSAVGVVEAWQVPVPQKSAGRFPVAAQTTLPEVLELPEREGATLGTLEVLDIKLNQGGCLDWGDELPNVTLHRFGLNFTGALENASFANFADDVAKVKINWNESVMWENTSKAGHKIVNYTSRIYHTPSQPKAVLENVYYNTTPAGNFVEYPRANYTEHFEQKGDGGGYDYWVSDLTWLFAGKVNGSVIMHFNYTMEVQVASWASDVLTPKVKLVNATNDVTVKFATTFQLVGDERLGLLLRVTPPDRNYLANFSWAWKDAAEVDFREVPSGNFTALAGNQFRLDVPSTYTVQLSYFTNFTVRLYPLVEGVTWSADRMVRAPDIRERDFFVQVVDGPPNLPVDNLAFNATIPDGDVQDAFDALDREVGEEAVNFTRLPGYSVPNGVLLSGVTVGPLRTGEVDKVTLRYRANAQISVVVADSISFPLPGVRVTLLVYDVRYGTKVALDEVRPFPSLDTNSRGQVTFENVPNYLNYSVEVTYRGRSWGVHDVNPQSPLNFLVTDVPHFPTWIVVWGATCTVVLLAGVRIYRVNQRRVPSHLRA